MRIVHICTKFSRTSETFIYDLIQGLEQAGAENHILTAARINTEERPFPRVRVLPLSFWRKAAFAIQKFGLGIYHFSLPTHATRQALRETRPDIIFAHFGGTGACIAPLAGELGIPLVVTFHAFDLFLRPFRPSTYRALWASGAYAVAISEHGKQRLIELGCPSHKVRVIHCGVDLSRFSQLPPARQTTNDFRLISIGRLVEKKGFDTLIQAVALASQTSLPRIRVDIYGEGPLRRSLEKLIRTLNLTGSVALRGSVTHQEVPTLLREYDAFALPSQTARDGDKEGIPITILEAQAAGLPVISTLHAGIPEAIPPTNREWLAHEGDAKELASLLKSMATRYTEREGIGRRGRDWVSRHFSLKDQVITTLHLLSEISPLPVPAPKGAG